MQSAKPNVNPENIINAMFGKSGGGANGPIKDAPPGEGEQEQQTDIFKAAETLMSNDTAMNWVQSKTRLDKERIKGLILPVLQILQKRSVEMYSAGDPVRAAKFAAGLESVNSYAGIIQDFIPLLGQIVAMIKEARIPEAKISDEDWADMAFEEAKKDTQGKNVDPNAIPPPDSRSMSSTANVAQPRAEQRLTWESLLNKHLATFGPSAMSETLKKDIESLKINVNVPVPHQPRNPSIPETSSASTPAIASFKNIIDKQANAFQSNAAAATASVEKKVDSSELGEGPSEDVREFHTKAVRKTLSDTPDPFNLDD